MITQSYTYPIWNNIMPLLRYYNISDFGNKMNTFKEFNNNEEKEKKKGGSEKRILYIYGEKKKKERKNEYLYCW